MSLIREEFWNVPNVLTLFRIAVIPVLCYWLVQGDPLGCLLAACAFGAAAITDFLDGWLARRQGLVTMTGKFLDPLADKLIVMAALVFLVDLAWFPAWLVVVVLAREISITALRAIAASEGFVMAAEAGGKYKTAFQLTGLFCLLLHFEYPIDFFLFQSAVDFNKIGFILFGISVFFSLWSAKSYVVGFYRALDERERATA